MTTSHIKALARLQQLLGKGAAQRMSAGQVLFVVGMLLLMGMIALFVPGGLLGVGRAFIIGCTTFYLMTLLYQIRVVTVSLNGATIDVGPAEVLFAGHADADWPFITVMVAAFHEAGVMEYLVDNLSRFDYPQSEYEVILVLEENDPETIGAVRLLDLPENFQVVIRPASHPSAKSKPGAIMYALEQDVLSHQSDFTVIYDAEDNPDPLQLKKAMMAMAYAQADDPMVVCVQGVLTFANAEQNWLTRMFALDYGTHFNLVLPGLAKLGLVAPLGGTTNFIETRVLRLLGYDPSNVTEDLNLAVMMWRLGLKIRVFSSVTMEEAVADPRKWVPQRSRWQKGALQTYLAHMRHPVALFQDRGLGGFLSFQLTVGGPIFSGLINPFFWGLTLLFAIFKPAFIQELYPGVVFHLATVSFLLGNFSFIYVVVLTAIKTRQYTLVYFAVFAPFYWALMSLAAYRALWEFLSPKKATTWSKTTHFGLASSKEATKVGVEAKAS